MSIKHDLESIISELKSDKTNLEVEVEDLKQRIAWTQEEREAAKKDLDETKLELEEMKANVRSLTKMDRKLMEERDEARAQLKRLQDALDLIRNGGRDETKI